MQGCEEHIYEIRTLQSEYYRYLRNTQFQYKTFGVLTRSMCSQIFAMVSSPYL